MVSISTTVQDAQLDLDNDMTHSIHDSLCDVKEHVDETYKVHCDALPRNVHVRPPRRYSMCRSGNPLQCEKFTSTGVLIEPWEQMLD